MPSRGGPGTDGGRGPYDINSYEDVGRNLFGGTYQPIEQLISGIPGERSSTVNEAFDRLHQQGYIQYHKNRTCASINPSHKEEVREFLSDYVADYIL